MAFQKVRYYIFLRDVFIVALTAFGGPQAHLALFLDVFVKKRGYLSEEDLLELTALCQVLPGPASTQTITALGYRIGGARLAYLTLLVWISPAVTMMTVFALLIALLGKWEVDLSFARFIQPMAVAFVTYSALMVITKVVKTKTSVLLLVSSGFLSYYFNNPVMLPALLVGGGLVASLKFRRHPEGEKKPVTIEWANFALFLLVFAAAALLGEVTGWLPLRLLENFYRNGTLIFGGGQVLIPLLYNEFVLLKHYLSNDEFLSGLAMAQAVPGPVFAFASYIGGLTLRADGMPAMLLGSSVATAGIFLPGTFLIFFVIRFWDSIKQYRVIKAALEGVHAVSAGIMVSAVIILMGPVMGKPENYAIILGTLALLYWRKIPAPLIIVAGLLAGGLV